MDNKGPRSLFVVVFYPDDPCFSILQLETPEDGDIFTDPNPFKQHVARFDQANGLPTTVWSVFPPISSTGDLYFFPEWCSLKPLRGHNFNFSTGTLKDIRLPGSMQSDGQTECAVSHGGRIYRIERCDRRSSIDYYASMSFFHCYVPKKKKWKALEPVPHLPYYSKVTATAVWNDTILFNAAPYHIWAYDVHGGKWYDVDVKDQRCFLIEGEAAVVKGTIYALKGSSYFEFGLLLALSIKKQKNGDDLVFKCSVSSDIKVEGLVSMFPMEGSRTTHLVHLGKLNFCVVQSCDPYHPSDFKPIHVTYMSLVGKTKMTVTATRMFETPNYMRSEVSLCFSLPKCKTAALGGKPLVRELDPYTAEVHNFICVRDYPLDVSNFVLEKELTIFGQIKSDGIQIMRRGGKSLACVEFESFISKKRALKAKHVMLGGHPAEILDKSYLKVPGKE